jgi:hypothetical protein
MAAIAAGVGAMVMCSSSLAAAMMMGGSEETPAAAAGAGAGAKTPADPCAGLVDDSLASTIPAKCLQKIFKDEGCTEEGTRYPGDDYNGWWRKDDGGGNYANVKRDINAWATMQDADHLAGCGRAT